MQASSTDGSEGQKALNTCLVWDFSGTRSGPVTAAVADFCSAPWPEFGPPYTHTTRLHTPRVVLTSKLETWLFNQRQTISAPLQSYPGPLREQRPASTPLLRNLHLCQCSGDPQ